jgi:hypothetical protein
LDVLNFIRSGTSQTARADAARPRLAARLSLAMLVVLALAACSSIPEGHDDVQPDSSGALWRPFEFPFKRATRYAPVSLDGRRVIQADADNAVSLYRREVRVEPAELGRLSFSWMVPEPIPGADLTRQDAEDAPVRVVLGFDGDTGKLAGKDRLLFDLIEGIVGEPPPYATLMYVWDNRAAVGSVIVAARTGRIRKIVVDSGPTKASVWRFHERDIARDFKEAFGEEPGALISIGLMTDSDNTRTKVRSYYGEVRLLERLGATP